MIREKNVNILYLVENIKKCSFNYKTPTLNQS